MLKTITRRINRELRGFFNEQKNICGMDRLSPYSLGYIKEFSLRGGKRIRPLLFIFAYLGFARKKADNLYDSAIALELIHSFILMHDDIVDRSDLRRGAPSLNKMVGSDRTMLIGDVLYSLGIKAFLGIKERPERKEKALHKLLEAAVYTGCGEINELLLEEKGIDKAAMSDIYSVYDLKTSYYTFVIPLVTGAILAGADGRTLRDLNDCGLYLGRAFQIKDDMLGLMADESVTGKSSLTDLREGKITLPLWHAYRNSNDPDKKTIRRILSASKVTRNDLGKVRNILSKAGTERFLDAEIKRLVKRSKKKILSCGIKNRYGQAILELSDILMR
jgi:geranylgeranyl diphosphate synthase, type I